MLQQHCELAALASSSSSDVTSPEGASEHHADQSHVPVMATESQPQQKLNPSEALSTVLLPNMHLVLKMLQSVPLTVSNILTVIPRYSLVFPCPCCYYYF